MTTRGVPSVSDEQTIIAALLGSYRFLLPEIVLGLTACAIYLAGTFRANRHLFGALALVGLAGAGVALALTADAAHPSGRVAQAAVFAGPVVNAALAVLIK